MTKTKFPFEGAIWTVDHETDKHLIRALLDCGNKVDLCFHTKNGKNIYYLYKQIDGKKYIQPITTPKALKIIEEYEKLCNDTI